MAGITTQFPLNYATNKPRAAPILAQRARTKAGSISVYRPDNDTGHWLTSLLRGYSLPEVQWRHPNYFVPSLSFVCLLTRILLSYFVAAV